VQAKNQDYFATNKRLEAMIEDGRFREDAVLPAAVVNIEIPP